jgi:acetyl-CoA acetyltransferase
MPAEYNLPEWYGAAGYMVTTQFFAAKIMRYMHLHGISRRTLGLVAQKAFANGAHAPHAWRREPVALDTILDAPMVSDPFTVHVLLAGRGAVALVLASERKARELGAVRSAWPPRPCAPATRAASRSLPRASRPAAAQHRHTPRLCRRV